MKKTKFYEFTQNNSGGEFDVDENVCHRVVIEAIDEKHAISIFEPMIENQSESCSCCGERWYMSPSEINIEKWKQNGYSVGVYSHYEDAEKRWFDLYGKFPRLQEHVWSKNRSGSKEFAGNIFFTSIEQYCQFLANNFGWTIPDVRIFYLDGKKQEIFDVKRTRK